MARVTAHQRTVDALLIESKGITLHDFIADRRDPDNFYGYERIARDLAEFTDGIVDVTGRTMERWHNAYLAVAA